MMNERSMDAITSCIMRIGVNIPYRQWHLRRRRYIPKPRVRGNAAYPGYRKATQCSYPNGVAQSSDVHGRIGHR